MEKGEGKRNALVVLILLRDAGIGTKKGQKMDYHFI